MSDGHDGQAVALILGASSSGGAGECIARALSREGYRVILAARRLEPLRNLARELDGMAEVCDIADESSVAALAGVIERDAGRLDVAVNAAGEAVMGTLRKTTEEMLDKALSVHLKGPFFFFKHMGGLMAGPGSLITVSTLTAVLALEGHGAYAAAKAGTDHLVKTAALELAPRGIKVNSVTPGFMITPMTQSFASDTVANAFIRETPLGRLTTPADVAAAVCFLASERAFMTGQNLQINGGATLRRMPTKDEFRG